MPTVHVFGGGTVFHVRPHLALTAPAYGKAARDIARFYDQLLGSEGLISPPPARLHLTKMAGGDTLETNADVAHRIQELLADPDTKIIFLSTALCDFEASTCSRRPLATWCWRTTFRQDSTWSSRLSRLGTMRPQTDKKL
jgi:hypothetical protein